MIEIFVNHVNLCYFCPQSLKFKYLLLLFYYHFSIANKLFFIVRLTYRVGIAALEIAASWSRHAA